MLKRVPALLIAFRVAIAPALFWLIVRQFFAIAAVGYILAVLSDIYDGVIARKLGVSTLRLRLSDGVADIWMYVCLGVGILIGFPGPLDSLKSPFFAAMGLQALSWLFCLWRFRKITSYHSFLAKLTALFLLAGILILLLAKTPIALSIALWVFVANLFEEIAMTSLLPEFHHDVWSIRAALKLRRTPEV